MNEHDPIPPTVGAPVKGRVVNHRVRCPNCRTVIRVLFEHPHPLLAKLGVTLAPCPRRSCRRAFRIIPEAVTAEVDRILREGVTVPGGDAGELRPVEEVPEGAVIEPAKVEPAEEPKPAFEVRVKPEAPRGSDRNAPCPCGSGVKAKRCHPWGVAPVEPAPTGVGKVASLDTAEKVADALRAQGHSVEIVADVPTGEKGA